MTIQPISGASVALYLTPADLRERGIRAEELTDRHALALTQDALRQAGLSLDGPLEIETYPDKCGLLVFVHIRLPSQTVWSFGDCEALLSAAAALEGEEADGALYWWGERYWLVLPGSQAGASARLSEFATRESADPYILARLEEYGSPILTGDAFATLRRHF